MASSTDAELAIRLRIAVARLGRRMRVAAVGGLTPSQLSALAALGAAGPMRSGDLASLEGVAAPSMTRIAATLEEAGLVGRGAAPGDRRCVVLHATAAGRARLEAIGREKTAFLSARLASLDPDLRGRLASGLPALEALLGEDPAPASPASASPASAKPQAASTLASARR